MMTIGKRLSFGELTKIHFVLDRKLEVKQRGQKVKQRVRRYWNRGELGYQHCGKVLCSGSSKTVETTVQGDYVRAYILKETHICGQKW